jgi:hypothetical protein
MKFATWCKLEQSIVVPAGFLLAFKTKKQPNELWTRENGIFSLISLDPYFYSFRFPSSLVFEMKN